MANTISGIHLRVDSNWIRVEVAIFAHLPNSWITSRNLIRSRVFVLSGNRLVSGTESVLSPSLYGQDGPESEEAALILWPPQKIKRTRNIVPKQAGI